MAFKVCGTQFSVPKSLAGKRMSFSVYALKGTLLQKGITSGDAPIILNRSRGGISEVRLIRLKSAQ
jgi:hypothetical protein